MNGNWMKAAFQGANASPEALMIATTKAIEELKASGGIEMLSRYDQARAEEQDPPKE